MRALIILLCLRTAAAIALLTKLFDSNGNLTFDSRIKLTNPLVRTFESKADLIVSPFWNHFLNRKCLLTTRSTIIFIEDEQTFILFNEEDQEKKSLLWIPWTNRALTRLYFTEVKFGERVYWTGSENYPFLTVSAEYSTNSLQIEREIVRGHSVRVNPSLLKLLGLLSSGWRIVLESTNSLYVAEKESIICRANPGGKVQLQITSKMLSFPAARSRPLVYDAMDKSFNAESWLSISCSVNEEEHDGILMFLLSEIILARCVTNETMFLGKDERKLLEYRSPFEYSFSFEPGPED